jgi:nicotinamide riboside transporter PnuC
MWRVVLSLHHVIFLVFAVVGVWLNNRKDRRCFFAWIISNLGWVCVNACHGLYVESAQNIIFLVLAFEGYYKWKS